MMRITSLFIALILPGVLSAGPASAQIASSEQELQQIAAALRANDAERRSSIATCIKQGAGANSKPTGIAQFLGVSAEQAWEVWCTRLTNGIAGGKLTLRDLTGLDNGTVTPAAREVLTTVSDGK